VLVPVWRVRRPRDPRLHGAHAVRRGWAMQVDLITPKLKPPRTKRMKLKCDNLLSNLPQICFQIQFAPLRRGAACGARGGGRVRPPGLPVGRGLYSFTTQLNLSRFGHTSPCPPV